VSSPRPRGRGSDSTRGVNEWEREQGASLSGLQQVPLWLPLRRLDWDEIKVSPKLRGCLIDWVDDYEHGTSGGSEAEFVAEGHELARLLSEELGWHVAWSA